MIIVRAIVLAIIIIGIIPIVGIQIAVIAVVIVDVAIIRIVIIAIAISGLGWVSEFNFRDGKSAISVDKEMELYRGTRCDIAFNFQTRNECEGLAVDGN